jgi:hypothetical protein
MIQYIEYARRNGASPAFAEGGPTESGGKHEPAGIVHKGEYVIPAHIVENPVFASTIQFIEYARQNGPRPAFVPIMKSLEYAQQRNMPGYFNGGNVGTGSSGSGSRATAAAATSAEGSSPVIVSSDPELKDLIRENLRVNKMLLRNGVQATMKFGYVEADNVKKGLDKLSDIQDKVTM